MPSIRFRLHEALAERFRWIQFPRQEFIPAKETKSRFAWATPMPLWRRIYIGFMSLLLLIVGGLAAVIVLNAIYLFVRALVSS